MPPIKLRMERAGRLERLPPVCMACGQPATGCQEWRHVDAPFCDAHIKGSAISPLLVVVPAVLGIAVAWVLSLPTPRPVSAAGLYAIAGAGVLITVGLSLILSRYPEPFLINNEKGEFLLMGACPEFIQALEAHRLRSNPFADGDNPDDANPFAF